jgi:hypothetical protein
MKHTPGPWTLQKHYNHANEPHQELFSRIGIAHKPLARLYPDCAFSGPEDEANAHLIAAAPDLLAACKIASVEVESRIGSASWAKILVKTLEAAIEAAEGRG